LADNLSTAQKRCASLNLAPAPETECAKTCRWVASLSSCSPADEACICGTLNTAGTAVNGCKTCIQALNATIAEQLSDVQKECLQKGLVSTPATTSGATGMHGDSLGSRWISWVMLLAIVVVFLEVL
jgi:hypothetical protein